MSDITIKTPAEIQKLAAGGRILAAIVRQLSQAVKPGLTTQDLEDLARSLMKQRGVEGSFLNFGEPPYPAVLCTSVNEEIVHCIPRQKVINEGDIIGIDCGIWYEGLCTDMARTVIAGKTSTEAKRLVKVTRRALAIAKAQIKPGRTIGDLGYAVQQYVEKNGFSVVRQLVGHGVGYEVHEEPRVPNYGRPSEGTKFQEGMVIAIEPMVNVGSPDIKVSANGWDITTIDGSLSAHFEDTVVVTKNSCQTITV